MRLEDVIKKVEDCPSSIFTLEDALKLVEMVEDDSSQNLTEEKINELKEELCQIVDSALENDRLFESIEVDDAEIALEWDELTLESVSFSLYYFKQNLHKKIEDLIV